MGKKTVKSSKKRQSPEARRSISKKTSISDSGTDIHSEDSLS
jgi:hypothetical protein